LNVTRVLRKNIVHDDGDHRVGVASSSPLESDCI
jgi:hypothetical protein